MTGTPLDLNIIGWPANRLIDFDSILLNCFGKADCFYKHVPLVLQAKSKCRACSKAIKVATKWSAEGAGEFLKYSLKS